MDEIKVENKNDFVYKVRPDFTHIGQYWHTNTNNTSASRHIFTVCIKAKYLEKTYEACIIFIIAYDYEYRHPIRLY